MKRFHYFAGSLACGPFKSVRVGFRKNGEAEYELKVGQERFEISADDYKDLYNAYLYDNLGFAMGMYARLSRPN
ncbi:hypothetical protein [Caballeronia sp. Lep1P3]|uniref:hypothetical protein n=1 Tax=Burkholderiaceae TaxID=119060 RepID=UPI001FD61DAA|nr:hypothetical protein [Caballeronia sp. Lep1P3]